MFAQRIGNVVKDIEIGEQRAGLEQHAHPLTHRIKTRTRHLRHVLAIKQDLSLSGGIWPPIRRNRVVLPIPEVP